MNNRVIFLLSLLALTGFFTSRAKAQDPYAKLLELNRKSSDIEFFASDGDGGWVIIFDDFGYAYYNFPNQAATSLRELNKAQKEIKSISFNPDGEWVLVHGKNGVHYSDIPADLKKELKVLNDQQSTIEFVTFSPTGGWVVVFDQYGYAYRGLPADCVEKLDEVNHQQKSITSVSFTPDGGWAILYGHNAYWHRGIPGDALEKMDEVNEKGQELESLSFNEKGEFVLVYDYNAFWSDLSDPNAAEPITFNDPITPEPKPQPVQPLPRKDNSVNQSPIAELNTAEYSDVKMWAVVVGVADYNHIKSLRFTDDDAYKFAMFLKSPEGGALSDRHMKILIDEDATRANILSTTKSVFSQADANDIIMFYFSGHGLKGAFLPIDYDGRNNKLYHTEVKKILQNSQAKHKICIADACHSGSLDRGARSATDADVIASFYEAWEGSSGGTALMMSSTAEEISIEFSGIRQGVFSYYLIKGLKGDADVNHNRIVTIRELFNYTRKNVRAYTRNRQNPVLNGNFDDEMPIGVMR